MKQARNNKRSNLVKVIAILSVLLALMLALLIWLEFGGSANADGPQDTTGAIDTSTPETHAGTQETTAPTDGEETVPTENGEETTAPAGQATEPEETELYSNGEIRTPYLTLNYPEALADHLVVVNTNDKPYTLEFYAVLEGRPEQRIFDIYLGEGANGNLGMVETESGNVLVGMTIYLFEPDDTWNQAEINTILAMQEGANELIAQLPLVQESDTTGTPVISTTPPESSIVNYMEIETPYCTLMYPVKWEEYVYVEQVEEEVYRVLFYGQLEGREKQLLFTVLFGGDEGEQLGVVTDDQGQTVPVNILLAELSLDGWPEEAVGTLYAMQEALNQLIEQLPLE